MALAQRKIEATPGGIILPPRYPGMIRDTDSLAIKINEWVTKVWEQSGGVDDLTIFPTDIIVAHFKRDYVGSSGKLYAAAPTQKEDQYQGKVGLVLAVGSNAFVDAPDAAFYGFRPAVGQWVVYKATDGRDMEICKPASTDKVLIRLLKDGEISMIVPRPDRVW